MALAAGTRLGPYAITDFVSKGGMGEVYKATDTRLDRRVAIKVLPQYVSSDPGLKQRFDREAKAISSLNHPHICTLHDVGHQDGIDFLVLEYLEGETLAERLTKGPLSFQQALSIATQVADALDKAHRQGIVHRDLKPGNIMLTKGGAKLLDFGLAKLLPVASVGAGAVSGAPTGSSPLTGAGSIVGTFQYMAPEQLEGRETDARTDIFAFGVVLYEMLTGKKAFEGKSQASLIAPILERHPAPPSAVQPLTPPALDHVVGVCLAKDADQRWQSAADLERELTWITETAKSTGGMPVSASTRRQKPVAWMVAGLGAGLILGTSLAVLLVRPWVSRSEPRSPEVIRTLVSVAPADQLRARPLDTTSAEGRPSRTTMVLAPDGRSLVFSAIHDGQQQLYLRQLGDVNATPIAGTQQAFSPFFSPDGRWLGFWVVGPEAELFKVAFPQGGPPARIWASRTFGAPFGATWGSDNSIVFAATSGGLWRISAAGGTAEPLTKLDATEYAHRVPFLLPGGHAVLFTISYTSASSWNAMDIAVQSLRTGERKILIKEGSDARYVPTGHVVYMRAGTLMAVPFNVETLEITADPVALMADVMLGLTAVPNPGSESGMGQFSVSEAGRFIYVPGGLPRPPERRLLWVDRTGAERSVPVPSRTYSSHRLSPDGQRIVFNTPIFGDNNVWVSDTSRGTASRLTDDGHSEAALWSPDGKRIAFTSVHGNRTDVMLRTIDDGSVERLTTHSTPVYLQSWLPDGSGLAFNHFTPETRNDISVLPVTGDRQPVPLLASRFNEYLLDFSPDGHWLAYTSDESGRPEVFVRPYPGAGAGQPISTGGGYAPAWSRDGRELFFTTLPAPDRVITMMAVPVTTRDQPSWLEPLESSSRAATTAPRALANTMCLGTEADF